MKPCTQLGAGQFVQDSCVPAKGLTNERNIYFKVQILDERTETVVLAVTGQFKQLSLYSHQGGFDQQDTTIHFFHSV